MKNRKSIISLLLVLCICLSSLAMFASAADTAIEPKATTRIVTCQVSAANFRRSPDASNPQNIIGNLMRGEDFHTSSESTATWYYGIPGPTTDLAAEFPGVKGYIKATAFSIY